MGATLTASGLVAAAVARGGIQGVAAVAVACFAPLLLLGAGVVLASSGSRP